MLDVLKGLGQELYGVFRLISNGLDMACRLYENIELSSASSLQRGHDTPFRRGQRCDKIYPGQSNSPNKACVSVGNVVFAVVWVLVRVVLTQDGFAAGVIIQMNS